MGAPQYEQAGADVAGSGTLNTIPRWTGATTLGDSLLSQSGTVITSAGTGLTFTNAQAWTLASNTSALDIASGLLKLDTASAGRRVSVATTAGFTFSDTPTAGVTIGTQGTSGGSFMVQTPSLNSSYGSGLAVDGTYVSGKSTINLKAFGVWSGGPYSSDLAFFTSTTTTLSEKMRIDSSGNVGIGTASPGTRLHVNAGSGIRVTDATGTDGFDFLNIGVEAYIYNRNNGGIRLGTNNTERFLVDAIGNIICNTAAIATTATNGFLYVPSCAGTPTGTPTTYTGRVPIVVDTTNNKLYFYSGGSWHDAGP